MDIQDFSIKPFPNSDIAESEEMIGQELFLYDCNSECVYTLNSGASMIWLLCDGTREVESIAEEISITSKLSETEILAYVQETVERLQSLGLFEPCGPKQED